MQNRTSNNSVQIAITAKDIKASEGIKKIDAALIQLRTSAEFTQAKVVVLTGAIAALGLKGAASVNTLAQSFGNLSNTIRGIGNTQVGEDTVFGLIQKQAEAALNQTRKLSEIMQSIDGLPSEAVKGITKGSREDPVKQLEGRFDAVAQKITRKLGEAFTNTPIGKLPFVDRIINQLRSTGLGTVLDQTLSEVVLDRFIKGKIPGVLKFALQKTLGQDLVNSMSNGIAGAFKNPLLSRVLSDSGKQLVGGSTLGFIEAKLSWVMTTAFRKGFLAVDKVVSELALKLGKEIGEAIFAPGGEGGTAFEDLDQIFGGDISSKLDELLPDLSKKITELTKIEELVSSIGGELALITAGSLSAFTIGGIGGAMLGNVAAGAGVAAGPLDNITIEVIRKFSGGLVTGMGDAVLKFTKLPQASALLVEFIVNKVLSAGIKTFLGRLPALVYEPLKKQIPDQFKGIFGIIEGFLLQRAGGIATAIFGQFSKVFSGSGSANLFDNLFKTPVQRLQKEIDALKSQAGEIGPLQDPSQLQQEAINVALDPSISESDRQARIDEINQLIEAAQKETEVRASIDELTTQMEELLSKPQKLQELAMDAALNTALTSEERQRLVDRINEEIEQAQRDIDLSPVAQLADDINKALFGPILGNKLGATLLESVLIAFGELNEFFDGAFTDALEIIGNNAGSAFRSGLSAGILSGLGPIIDEVDEALRGVVDFARDLPNKFAQPIEGVGNVFGYLSGIRDPFDVLNGIKEGASSAFSAIARVGEQLTFFQSGLQTVQSVVMGGPFQSLIGQNIELREQLLATQSTLASTSKVISNTTGAEIKDPLQAILAVEAPVMRAMENVRRGSLELVGVTSNQLIESFDIIAGQASAIGLSLDESSKLTLSFAAALGTLGIPLFQARQEITSIVQGTIDQNSALAKAINLTNEQVRTWKQQGNVFEKLTERLEAFRAGNQLAAQTVGGISSNIQEIFETIGRKAGEPLLDPIVKELGTIYDFLEDNEEAIVKFVSDIALQIFEAMQIAFDAIKEALAPLQGLATSLPEYFAKSLVNSLKAFAEAAKTTSAALQPFIATFVKLFEVVRPIGGPILEITLKAKALQFGITTLGSSFGTLSNIIPGIGEILFGMNLRMLPLLNTFPSLAAVVGQGGAGFLALGKHLHQIPGAAGVASKALGPLGPLLVGLIPMVAGLGVQVVGLASVFPPLKTAIQGVLAQNPADLVAKLAQLTTLVPGLGFLKTSLDNMSLSLRATTQNMTVATFATAKFKEVTRLAFIELRKFAINLVFLGAALFLAFKAIDKFVLSNEQLLETLKAIAEGLKTTVEVLIFMANSPAIKGVLTLFALVALQMSGLYGWLVKITAIQIAGWLTGLASALGRVSGFLALIKLQGMALGAQQAAIGFNALSIALTQGTAASARFLAANNINVVSLGMLKTSLIKADIAFAKFLVSTIKAAFALLVNMKAGLSAATTGLIGFIVNMPAAIASMGATSAAAGTTSFSFVALLTSLKATTLGFIAQAKSAILSIPALIGSGGAAGAASAGFATLATAIGKVVVGLFALLLPLAAIAAAFAAIGLFVYSQQLKKANEETEVLRQSSGLLADEALKLQGRVKAAQEAQAEKAKQGITLTQEEIAANQGLMDQVGRTTEAIEQQIKALREEQNSIKGKGNKEALALQIKELEVRLASLQETANNVDIAPRDLVRLGTVYQQLADKVLSAEVAVKQAAGDPALFKAKAGELIDLTNQQLKLGQITADEARRRFELLSSNAVADQEVQLKAQQAITESLSIENERRVKISEAAQSEIQMRVQEGQLSEAEGDRLVTEEKIRSTNRRIAAIRRQYNIQSQLRQKDLEEEIESLAKEREEAQAIVDRSLSGEGVDPKVLEEAQATLERLDKKETEFRDKKALLDKRAAEDQANEMQSAISERSQLAAQERKRLKQQALADFDEQLSALESQRSAYLIGEDQFNKSVLKNRQDRINLEITQQKASLNKLAKDDKEGREAILANIDKLKKEGNDLQAQERRRVEQQTLTDFDEQIAALDKQRSLLLLGESDFAAQSVKVRTARFDTEIEQQKIALARLTKDDKEGREAILANIDKLEKERGDIQTQERKRLQQQILENFDEELAILESNYAKRLIGLEDFNASSVALQKERIEVEIEQRRSDLERLAKTDIEGREVILSAIATLEKRSSDIINAERKRRQDLIVEDYTEELAFLNAARSQGEVTEIEFYRRSIALRQEQKEVQIAQAKEELALLAATDKEGRERILAQIAQFETDKADLQAEAHAVEVREIERVQEEVLRTVTEAEQQRLIELQKLYNAGELRSSAFEEKKIQLTLKRIKAELQAEKDKLDALSALPPLSDPVKERERQKQIFDIRSRITQQTLSLLQTEEQAYQAYIARIREALEAQNQRLANQIEAQNQALTQQTLLYDALSKALTNQNRLLEARRSLSKASADFITGSLDTISKLETSEFRRQKLAEATAAIRLKALEQELEYERQGVILNQQQNALALEREKIQNRIAQAQAKAEIAQVDADIAIAKLNRQTTPEQLEALRLRRGAILQKVQGLQTEGGFLEQQGAMQNQINQMELQSLEMRQRGQRTNAIADLIQTLPEGKRGRYARQLQNEIAQQLGAGNKAQLIQQGRVTTQDTLAELFPGVRRGGMNPLEVFDPRLEELQGYAGGGAINRAYNDAALRYGIQYGLTGMGLGGQSAATGRGLSLPESFAAQPMGTAQISMPATLERNQDKPLVLPSLTEKGFTLAGDTMKLSSDNFTQSVDRFAEIIDTLKTGQTTGVTLNANITIPVQADTQKVGESAKKEVSRQLNDLVRRMEVQLN